MNLNDPTNNLIDLTNDLTTSSLNVHIRITKRNGRKSITSIEGLNDMLFHSTKIDDLLKEFRKKFSCNGTVKEGMITLQGDHRQEIATILVERGICKKEQIKIHGF